MPVKLAAIVIKLYAAATKVHLARSFSPLHRLVIIHHTIHNFACVNRLTGRTLNHLLAPFFTKKSGLLKN